MRYNIKIDKNQQNTTLRVLNLKTKTLTVKNTNHEHCSTLDGVAWGLVYGTEHESNSYLRAKICRLLKEKSWIKSRFLIKR